MKLLSGIYGADEKDNWEDEITWKKVNPSIGTTFTMEKIRNAYETAKGNPVEEKLFRQLRLNVWSEETAQWLPIEMWYELAESYDEYDLHGKVCYGGLDLSSTTDITAFVLVFPPEDDGDKFCVLPYFWIPEAGLKNGLSATASITMLGRQKAIS